MGGGAWGARQLGVWAPQRATHPRYSSVWMLKPSVGLMEWMSSPMNFFRMVVFPALSKPLRQREGGEEGARVHGKRGENAPAGTAACAAQRASAPAGRTG